MDGLKRILGLIWMLLGPAAVILLVYLAYKNINGAVRRRYFKPSTLGYVIAIFTPIAIGLSVFGWYSWKGEYNTIPPEQSSRARLD
jgi:ABC-type polysaccharide/polyol phosphate export permease